MPELTKITPSTAPVGARLLIKPDRPYGELREVKVLEWSPSEKAVKLHFLEGGKVWVEDLPLLVEVLPQSVDFTAYLAAYRSLDDNLKRIHERYGNDFEAFFKDVYKFPLSPRTQSIIDRTLDEVDSKASRAGELIGAAHGEGEC
jgi:hypothetical protein